MTTILKTLVGSHAHGLSTHESDYDWREVFVRPTEELLRVDPPAEKALGDDALTAWEVGHVLRLAMKCNPTILEVLAGQSEHETWFEGLPLLELFPAFLSKKRVLDAFHGYAHQQRHKLEMAKLDAGESEAKELRRRKALAARLRILFSGGELLRTGNMTVRIVDVPVIGEQVKRAKFGDMTNEEGAEIADALKLDLDAAFGASRLPDAPDIETVNAFLITLRRSHLAA